MDGVHGLRAFSLGEQRMLLGSVLGARLYADTVIITSDEPQTPGLEQGP
jgi:hypothetical protein